MKVCCCVVKRNESISVRTLHTILRITDVSRILNTQLSIEYINETQDDVSCMLKKIIKTNDRIIWLGYGVGVTDDVREVDVLMAPYPKGYHGSILPCAREGIDWDAFITKMKSDGKEPPKYAGLHYDTDVTKTKISDDVYAVNSVHDPKLWSIECAQFLKKMKGKKGEGITVPKRDLVNAVIKSGIKMCAYVSVRTTITYAHECVGSIIETAANR